MRVLHVTQKLPGGPASYLSEVLPWQLQHFGSDNVRLVACGSELDHLPGLPHGTIRPFADSGRGPAALLRFGLAAMRAVRDERPDVVHLHSTFPGLMRLPLAMLPRSRRPAVVYCSHGWAFNMRTARWKRRVYAAIERALAPLCDRSIAISAFEARSALARKLPARNLSVIENGVSATVPPIGEPAYATDGNALQLVFIGRLDRQKGYDVLEDAMARLTSRPVHLHVIGARVVSGGEATIRDLPNVTHHGWQDRASVAAFIARADAVVMPSRWEGFGLVAVEAMRQGKPVLASRVDALPDVVGDTGILFEPEDPAALAQAIKGLDRGELRAMGVRARARFAERFTSDRMNAQIAQCYREILGLTPKP